MTVRTGPNTIEDLVSFRSAVERVDGSTSTLRIDTVGEISLPSERSGEALTLRGIPRDALSSELAASATETLVVAEMTAALKSFLEIPEDETDWENIIEDFNRSGWDFGDSARVLTEHWSQASNMLLPWGGRCSGIAAVDRLVVDPAIQDPAGIMALLLRELASVTRPFEPIPFVHFAGVTAPSTSREALETRQRARLLSALPVSNIQALTGQRAGWVVGLLEERDIQTGREAYHWVSFRLP